MALSIGTQLGSHEITALLGKGGMGEVYRARDLKLKREVRSRFCPKNLPRDACGSTGFNMKPWVSEGKHPRDGGATGSWSACLSKSTYPA
jgi:hypothetical protein